MLENPRSPRVRAVAKLAKKPARVETGMFLLEGPQAVAEALTFRPQLVVELYATSWGRKVSASATACGPSSRNSPLSARAGFFASFATARTRGDLGFSSMQPV